MDDGDVYCWGSNGYGQLGDGTSSDRTAPVPVAGGLTFHRLSAGGTHACGLVQDGQAYCWGANFEGQLGDGTVFSSATPVPVSGALTFQDLDAGFRHTCAVASGQGYCWGMNTDGQLGANSLARRSTIPVAVVATVPFDQITASGTNAIVSSHTCALDTERRALCWGWNGRGQLGDGTPRFRVTPTPVLGDISF